MKYIEPIPAQKSAALEARAQNRVEELPELLVSVALYEIDLEWAASYCISLATHSDEFVRGNAILGFGHLARRFGALPEEAKAILIAGLGDGSAYVRGQASAAADDTAYFLGWTALEAKAQP